MKRIIASAIFSLFSLCAISVPAAPPSQGPCGDDKLIFGTGDTKGTYAAMFKNIQGVCPVVCEYFDEKGTPSTGGFMNASLLTNRKIDAGMVPEDVLELAKRTDPIVVKKVRVLGALHTNAVHIIVPKDGIMITGSGFSFAGFDTGIGKSSTAYYIKDLSDLKGKKVAVFGSAIVTMTFVNERLGYNLDLMEVGSKDEGFKLLGSGQAFAFVTTGGWPIPWVDTMDKKYTLANVSDADVKRLAAPFYSVTLNYNTLGARNVGSFGARNVIAAWDYASAARIDQLMGLKSCIEDGLADIKEVRGSHPSWVEVETFSPEEKTTWPVYAPKVPNKPAEAKKK